MKIFLGGAETHTHGVFAYTGQTMLAKDPKPQLLGSFYHLLKKGPEKWIQLYRNLPADWLIDSGLFTMMFGVGKGKKYNEEDLLIYTNKYLDFVANVNYNHTIIEMDVHKVLGLQSLAKFRKLFEKRWGTEKTIFVWHLEEGIGGLINLANKYEYIALSIPELRILAEQKKKPIKTMVNSLFNIIKKNTKEYPKIHLLGCTQRDLMLNSNYYSVDSTSWEYGMRFDTVHQYTHGTSKNTSFYCDTYKHYKAKLAPTITKALKANILKSGLKIKLNDYTLNGVIQAYSYYQFETYINNRYYQND